MKNQTLPKTFIVRNAGFGEPLEKVIQDFRDEEEAGRPVKRSGLRRPAGDREIIPSGVLEQIGSIGSHEPLSASPLRHSGLKQERTDAKRATVKIETEWAIRGSFTDPSAEDSVSANRTVESTKPDLKSDMNILRVGESSPSSARKKPGRVIGKVAGKNGGFKRESGD